jgi:uncharacterized protein
MTADDILAAHEHRPFPLPKSPWVMRQEWHDLLFGHWALPADVVRAVLPRELQAHLDLWKGQAYVAVVPFVIRNLRPRGVPSIPVISHFAENNVRTYVTVDGKPGVYFFSLDAANVSAVLGARLVYGLPYFKANFRIQREGDTIRYKSRRTVRPRPAEFVGEYRPASEVLPWQPMSEKIERYVTERYCLYSVIAGRVYRTNIHHPPWPLQLPETNITINSMARTIPLHLDGPPLLLHFSKFMDVLTWLPERIS